VILSASQTHRVWREPKHPRLAQISRHRPIGTTFRFTLDKAARMRLAFVQLLPGRRVGGRCVAVTKRNKAKPRCTRAVLRGSLNFSGHAGLNTVRFHGRISRTRKLSPGRYRLLISATTPGVGSTSRTLTFTIAT
jgi:hypothetical protein